MTDADAAHLASIKERIVATLPKDKEVIHAAIQQNPDFSANNELKVAFLDAFDDVFRLVEFTFAFKDEVFLQLPDWKLKMEYSLRNIEQALNFQTGSDLINAYGDIFSAQSFFNTVFLSANLTDFHIHFKRNPTNENYLSYLHYYINIGKKIRAADASPSGGSPSPFGYLDQFAANPVKFLSSKLKLSDASEPQSTTRRATKKTQAKNQQPLSAGVRKATRSARRSSIPASAPVQELEKVFAALVGPSMVGKTQSAFTISTKPVLFFAVAASRSAQSQQQQIYSNFTNHAKILDLAAGSDVTRLRHTFEINHPYHAFMLESIPHVPLYTIGFWAGLLTNTHAKLKKLNEEALRNGEEITWMEAYAQVDDFSFQPMSMNQFQASFPDKNFCVFLDEFLSEPSWPLYVRNLARALQIPCIVSNTNTSVANLVGSQNTSRGPDTYERTQNNGWSLVFNRFGRFERKFLDGSLGEGATVDSLIAALKLKCTDVNDPAVSRCFDQVFDEGLDCTRPGVALIVIRSVQKLVKQRPKSFAALLQFIFTEIQVELCKRKPNMKFNDAQVPKLGLLFPHAYRQTPPDPKVPEDAVFNYKAFMDYHLYHLLDPSGSPDPFFLTFIPEYDSSSLRYHTASGTLVDWSPGLTSFDKREFFTIMACSNIQFKITSVSCLQIYFKKHGVHGFGLGNASNPAAQKRSGNLMEVYAAVGVVDSSQYRVSSSGAKLDAKYSLNGQSGESFLKNLLNNCIYNESAASTVYLRNIQFPAPLKNWLGKKSLKFPLLHGVDLDASTGVLNSLPQISPGKGSVYIQKYERCADAEQIDGFFTFLEDERVVGCSVECNNMESMLDVAEINSALRKAFNMKKKFVNHQLPPRLMLIFCNEIDPNATMNNALYKHCTEEPECKINLYRAGVEKGKFVVKAFLDGWKLFDNPHCHAIVIRCPL